VDATEAAQKVLHAELSIPARAGALTLYYPKWMPADHSPDGPIWNVAGLKFSAAGKSIPWTQDSVDMYAFHLEVPQGTNSVTAKIDFLLSAPGPTIDFSASGTAKLFVLMWNQVVLYPSGWPVSQITFQPRLTVPNGWTIHTALPIAEQSSATVTFKSVALDLLIDSPVQSGAYTKVIPLTPGQNPLHEIDLAADSNSALDIPPAVINNYKRLVEEAQALYQSHHYREYHFLLTLSDNIMGLGQEHHESSDDRVPANALSDPNQRLLGADLLPHEFTHSWNGQYRRPEGLATPDFQQPMKGELLWVYEGLTTYLGTVLAARSGLWNAEQTREHLALLASTLDHRAGRSWRSLENTSRAAQILYFAPSEWASYRRGTDFYPESVLIWLEADVTIRKLTDGHRSLDDFCRTFLGGPEVMPVVKTFNFDDLVTAMNEVATYDWRRFFLERLQSVDTHAPLGGLGGGGWELTYNDEPNQMIAASQAASRPADYTASIGVLVKADGTVEDAIPGMPAYQRGIRPYTRILAVNGHQFSIEELNRALAESKTQTGTIILLVSNAGFVESHQVEYHGGPRYPHLVRNEAARDFLNEILKPRMTQ
jgi:predicted metalloprotease with PDZ domain